MAQPPRSLISFFAPRVPLLPSSASVAPEIHFWTTQASLAINALPTFSSFSWASPNSNVTALPGTIGVNYASGVSVCWVKQVGSGMTGWVAIA